MTITGTGFTGTTAVKFGTTSATGFTVVSATSITATSPAGSGTANVKVTTPSGTSATASGNQFTYVGAPTVTALSPASGPALGGTSVTITGTGFTGATAVTFGATSATVITVVNATSIIATSPTGTGMVDVRVTTPGGISATGAGDQFTYSAPAPTVTSISPSSGPVAGGISVTITGTGFTGTTAVKFGTTSATGITVVSATSITATSPAGTGSVDVTVTTPAGTSATGLADHFTYITIVLAPSSLAGGTVAASYSGSITATGGATPYTYSLTAGTLPAGMTLNTSTGALSGTPTAAGTFNFTVKAQDANSFNATQTYSLVIAAPTVTLTPTSLPSITAETAYSTTLTGAGGIAPYSFTITGGALPTGLTLNSSTGLLSGTTTQSGSFSVTIKATDSSTGSGPFNASHIYALTVGAPAITLAPSSLASGTVAVSYTASITASGGSGSYTYSLTAGTLPAGMTLNTATGALSGTPTAAGTFSFTVKAQDINNFSATQTYSLVIAAATVTLTPSTLPALTAETAYSTTLTAAGGIGPYSFAITGGALPTGLSLNTSTGVLSGTTTASGSFSVTIKATDSSTGNGAPFNASQVYAGTIGSPTISFASGTVVSGAVAASYSGSITASGGAAPFSYSLTAGTLPAGMTLNTSTGALSGTPTAAGTFSFTVKAQDANSFNATQTYSLVIAAPTVTLTPTSLPSITAETAYSTTLTGAGGIAPYSFAITGGALPTGLSLNTSTGVLSGTTTQGGNFSVTIKATDSSTGTGAPFNASQVYAGTIGSPTISFASGTVASGAVAASYSGSITASGGAAPFTYSLTAGTLPAGITLNTSTGALSGTPTAAGTFNFIVRAQDVNSFSASRNYCLVIGAATVTLTPSSLPAPTAETAYSTTLTAAGGIAPYSFTVTGGTLPTGLTLNPSTGVLAGTTTQGGNFSVTIKATDSSTGTSAPFTAVQTYAGTIGSPAISFASGTVASGAVATSYTGSITASGGASPFTYSLTAGTLPAGMTLNAWTGALSGTPTAAGTFSFTVKAQDADNFSATQTYSLMIGAATVTLTPASLPSPMAEIAYSTTLTAAGGIAPYSFTITGGTLPIGLSLNTSTGVLSGTTVQSGSFSVAVKATDSSTGSGPFNASHVYALTVGSPSVTLTSGTVAGGTVSLAYSQQFAASGGLAPYTFTVASGSLPAGLTLTSSGLLSGTPTSAGNFAFTVQAADAARFTAQQSVSLNVNAQSLATAHSASTLAGMATTVDLMAGATGGPFTAAAIVSVSPASAGAAVLTDSGNAGQHAYQMRFTPTPTFAGAVVVSYTLSNAYTTSPAANVTITVAARVDIATAPRVVGMVTTHVASAQHFATAQLSNFTHRLETLHGDGWGRSGFGISLAPTGMPTDANTVHSQGDNGDQLISSNFQSSMRKARWRQTGDSLDNGRISTDDGTVLAANGTLSDNSKNGSPGSNAATSNEPKQSLSLWVGGAVDFGQQNVSAHQSGTKFNTSGVSLGGEYRLSEFASIGLGAGFGHDRTDIGTDGSRSINDNLVAAVYGSLRPGKDFFIDGVLGYGTLNFDTTRFIDGGGYATGKRRGSQIFGAVTGGIEQHNDSWMWSPYGRLEVMSATLDQYSETAADLNALTYFKQTVRNTSGILGIRTENRIETSLGTLIPRARLEFSHQFQSSGDAPIAYADVAAAGPTSIIRLVNPTYGNWVAGLGVRLVLHNHMSLTIDFNSNLNMTSGRSQSVRAVIEVPIY